MDMYNDSMNASLSPGGNDSDDGTASSYSQVDASPIPKEGAGNKSVLSDDINTTPKPPKRLPLTEANGYKALSPATPSTPTTPAVGRKSNPYMTVNPKGALIVSEEMNLALDSVIPVFGPSKVIYMDGNSELKYAPGSITKHTPDNTTYTSIFTIISNVKIASGIKRRNQPSNNSLMMAIPVSYFDKISEALDRMAGGQDARAIFNGKLSGNVTDGYVTINAAYSLGNTTDGNKPACKVLKRVYQVGGKTVSIAELSNLKSTDIVTLKYEVVKTENISDYLSAELTKGGGTSYTCDIVTSLSASQTTEGKTSVKATVYSINLISVDTKFIITTFRTPAIIANQERSMSVQEILAALNLSQ